MSSVGVKVRLPGIGAAGIPEKEIQINQYMGMGIGD